MPITDKFIAINIRKYLALGDASEAGEPALEKLLSGFFCPMNLARDNGEMLGYFTLALKPLTVRQV